MCLSNRVRSALCDLVFFDLFDHLTIFGTSILAISQAGLCCLMSKSVQNRMKVLFDQSVGQITESVAIRGAMYKMCQN